jgi:hypothetical protein
VEPAATPPHARTTPGNLRVGPLQHTEEGTAAGIYGIIVSAGVMAASHASTAAATVVAVLVTLTIYWAAERYARIVAGRIHVGHRPSSQALRRQLTIGWEMITASTLPLVVLLLARLVGAGMPAALYSALTCSTVLLCAAGWRIGRNGGLTRWERVTSSAVASLFGVGLIILKTILH